MHGGVEVQINKNRYRLYISSHPGGPGAARRIGSPPHNKFYLAGEDESNDIKEKTTDNIRGYFTLKVLIPTYIWVSSERRPRTHIWEKQQGNMQ